MKSIFSSSRLPVSPKATIQTRNPVHCKESEESRVSNVSTLVVSENLKETLTEQFVSQNDKRSEHKKLFFLSSELNVSQIIDNPKVKLLTQLVGSYGYQNENLLGLPN